MPPCSPTHTSLVRENYTYDTQTHTHTHRHTDTQTQTQTQTQTHTHTNTHTHTHLYIRNALDAAAAVVEHKLVETCNEHEGCCCR